MKHFISISLPLYDSFIQGWLVPLPLKVSPFCSLTKNQKNLFSPPTIKEKTQ